MRLRAVVAALAIPFGLAAAPAPPAGAQPNDPLPSCTTVNASGMTTECQSPGNVQISTSAPQVEDPVYGWPEGEYFPYGPFLVGGAYNHSAHR